MLNALTIARFFRDLFTLNTAYWWFMNISFSLKMFGMRWISPTSAKLNSSKSHITMCFCQLRNKEFIQYLTSVCQIWVYLWIIGFSLSVLLYFYIWNVTCTKLFNTGLFIRLLWFINELNIIYGALLHSKYTICPGAWIVALHVHRFYNKNLSFLV